MWRHTILGVALVSVGVRWCLADPADEQRQALLKQCTTLQEEIYEQRRLANELFAELLEEGVKSGAWSAADRAIALESHAEVLLPIPTENASTADAIRRSKAKRTPQRGLELPVAALRATTPVESWFLLHRYYLDGLFDSATQAQARAAVENAESVWLKAQKGADLVPAIRPLLDARERGVRWPMNGSERRAQSVPLGVRYNPRITPRADAIYSFDAWTIVASPDGLLPPDPETATAAEFSRWREAWSAVRGIGNTFVIRPAITARVAETLARRTEAEKRRTEAVNRRVLEDAPLPQIEEALKSLSDFVGQTLPPNRPGASSSPSPFGPVRDYRDLIREAVSQQPGRIRQVPGVSPDWFAACNLYVYWMKTKDARPEEAEKARAELQKSLRSLPIKVAEHVGRRIQPPTAALETSVERLRTEAVPGREAETLAAALEQIAGDGAGARRANPEFTALAAVLRGGPAQGAADRKVSERFDYQWLALAEMPEARRLIPLRDAAIRGRLKQLGIATPNAEKEPVLLAWREGIAKEAEAGRLESVGELLELDRRYSIAPLEESHEWSEFLRMMQSTPSPASGALRAQLLRSNPTLMRVMALKLKAAGGG